MHGRQNGSLGKPISLKQIQNNVIFGGGVGGGGVCNTTSHLELPYT